MQLRAQTGKHYSQELAKNLHKSMSV